MSRAKKVTSTPTLVTSTPTSEWETTHSGTFPPMWVPESENEFCVIIPTGIREITVGKGKKAKENYTMDCRFIEGEGNFALGSGNSKRKVDVSQGDLISIPLSYNLLGEMALATQDGDAHPELSKLTKFSMKNASPIRVTYLERVKIGGGRSVKVFTVQAPKGVKEQLLSFTE